MLVVSTAALKFTTPVNCTNFEGLLHVTTRSILILSVFAVDYGRSSSIQMTMTTKSGGNRHHGNASDYFNYQGFFASTEFTRKYTPFHSNNISATIGGPIVPRHNGGFFFFAIEPLRSSTAVSSNIAAGYAGRGHVVQ